MTDEELLGQVFFLGWQGVGPSAGHPALDRHPGDRRDQDLPAERLRPAVPGTGRGGHAEAGVRGAGSASRCSSPPTRKAAGSGRSRTRHRSHPGNLALGATGVPGDCVPDRLLPRQGAGGARHQHGLRADVGRVLEPGGERHRAALLRLGPVHDRPALRRVRPGNGGRGGPVHGQAFPRARLRGPGLARSPSPDRREPRPAPGP